MAERKTRFFIWEGDPAAAISPLDPDRLRDLDDAWKSDVEAFGPWTQVVPGPEEILPAGRLWEARIGRQESEAPRVFVCGACPSAMDAAWYLIAKGILPAWDSIVVTTQTAGRGQHQRSWQSPVGNLYAAWHWPVQNADAAGWGRLLPLIAGFLLAEYLAGKGIKCRIKWPNDVLLNGRKTGGILMEKQRSEALVGIGINLASHPPDAVLRNDFAVPATSLLQEGFPVGPLLFWQGFVEFAKHRFHWIVGSLSPEEWLALFDGRLAWRRRKVLVKSGGQAPYEAEILGLCKDGGLRLKKGVNQTVIYSGSLIPV
jgi:BirA family biotin operon repressor/biotin-[acetyl-CoA-carboxylase] ligase